MITTITMTTGFLLILLGLYGALVHRNILRMIIAFSIANTGVNMVLVAVGYMHGRTAPILDSEALLNGADRLIIDPLPQALVLTAIVIGVGIIALMLAYAYRLFESRGTLNIDNFKDLKW
ncbi:cation:proton antiporter [Ectothiorhodospiraceae bacterium BW-2]|nr:cation:proton antiporter [Ectothiorhodospiraceae bacterium BW-2]